MLIGIDCLCIHGAARTQAHRRVEGRESVGEPLDRDRGDGVRLRDCIHFILVQLFIDGA